MEAYKPRSLVKKLPSYCTNTLDYYYSQTISTNLPRPRFYSQSKEFFAGNLTGPCCNDAKITEEYQYKNYEDSNSILFVSSSSSSTTTTKKPYYLRPDGFVVFTEDPFILFLNKDLYREYLIKETENSVRFLRDECLVQDLIFHAMEELDRIPEWSSKRQNIINTLGFLFDILHIDEIINPESTFGETEQEIFEIFDYVQNHRTNEIKEDSSSSNNAYFIA